ncbi:MAG: hypothetical protein EPO06_11795 [Burkholderiaceae bacterium]|nr:MAG: hypothetical protein EPO06_11795 [Burkholderiaceae bacterium]
MTTTPQPPHAELVPVTPQRLPRHINGLPTWAGKPMRLRSYFAPVTGLLAAATVGIGAHVAAWRIPRTAAAPAWVLALAALAVAAPAAAVAVKWFKARPVWAYAAAAAPACALAVSNTHAHVPGAGVKALIGVGVLILALVVGLLLTMGEYFAATTRWYMAAIFGAGGGFVAWSIAASITAWPLWVLWVASVVVGFAAWPHTRTMQITHEENLIRRMFAASNVDSAGVRETPPADPDAARLWRLWRRFDITGLRFLGRVDAGKVLALRWRLPQQGVNYDKILANVPDIEQFARWPVGAMRLERDRTTDGREESATFTVYIDLSDVLTADLPYVDDETPLSFHDPINVGKYMDSTDFEIDMAEAHQVTFAPTGSGKSNFLHVQIAQTTRMPNACTIVIDPKGRLVKPWLQPWDEAADDPYGVSETGKIERPPLLAAAIEPMGIYCLLAGVIAGIRYRASVSFGGAEKIEATPKAPGVFVFVDELPTLVGQHADLPPGGPQAADFNDLFTQGVTLGRSEGVIFAVFTQRGTVTMSGGGDFLSQPKNRYGLGGGGIPVQEASYMFGNQTQLPHARILAALEGDAMRGAIVGVGVGSNRAMAGKVMRLPADDVPAISARRWCIPPDLDDGTAEAMDAGARDAHWKFCLVCQASGGDGGPACDGPLSQDPGERREHLDVCATCRASDGNGGDGCPGDAHFGWAQRWQTMYRPHHMIGAQPQQTRRRATRPNSPAAMPAGLAVVDNAFAAALTMTIDDDPEVIAYRRALLDADADEQAADDTATDARPAPPEVLTPERDAMYRHVIAVVRAAKWVGLDTAEVRALLKAKYGDAAPDRATVYRWLTEAATGARTGGRAELAHNNAARKRRYWAPEYKRKSA